MSNIINFSDIYSQIVELKKKKLELAFLPVSERSKDYPSQIRQLRKNLAKLKRDIAEFSLNKKTMKEKE
jgi:ribosomal protein L29